MVSVAPSSRASSSLAATTSTATIRAVPERAAAVAFLLQDDLVDKPPRLHAAQGDQAVRPSVSGLPDEFGEGLGRTDAGLPMGFEEGVHDPAGVSVLFGQMRHLIERDGCPVHANAQGDQAHFQISGLPDS